MLYLCVWWLSSCLSQHFFFFFLFIFFWHHSILIWASFQEWFGPWVCWVFCMLTTSPYLSTVCLFPSWCSCSSSSSTPQELFTTRRGSGSSRNWWGTPFAFTLYCIGKVLESFGSFFSWLNLFLLSLLLHSGGCGLLGHYMKNILWTSVVNINKLIILI